MFTTKNLPKQCPICGAEFKKPSFVSKSKLLIFSCKECVNIKTNNIYTCSFLKSKNNINFIDVSIMFQTLRFMYTFYSMFIENTLEISSLKIEEVHTYDYVNKRMRTYDKNIDLSINSFYNDCLQFSSKEEMVNSFEKFKKISSLLR